MEARETGKTSLKIPSVGLSSGQVNRVQEQISVQDICTYCGKRGHGKQPSLMKLMKKQQNMMKLRHEEWCDNFQTYIKASLRKNPTIKIRMCLDILSYKKHDPPLDCQVQQKWIDSLENRQQKDIVLKTSTNDTGAQCFVLGRDHLPGLGVAVENLLRSEINLGVFFAKIRGEHHVTAESVEARARLSFSLRVCGYHPQEIFKSHRKFNSRSHFGR